MYPNTKTYHAAAGSNCVRGQVVCKVDTDGTAVAVRAHNATPDNTVASVLTGHLVLGGTLSLVDIGDTLTKVVASIILGVDALNLDQRLVVLLHALTALVAENDGLGVQPAHK